MRSRPSTDCALVGWTRVLLVPDRKSSRRKGGYVSTVLRGMNGLCDSCESNRIRIKHISADLHLWTIWALVQVGGRRETGDSGEARSYG